jgi:hypothetical protein
MHKGFKCLDVAEGWLYISHDILFDETVFPFTKLNPNTGARLQAEIHLLPPNSIPPTTPSHGDEFIDSSTAYMHVNPISANSSQCLSDSKKIGRK